MHTNSSLFRTGLTNREIEDLIPDYKFPIYDEQGYITEDAYDELLMREYWPAVSS